MHIRSATVDDAKDIDCLLASAYVPVMARMQQADRVGFEALLPKARARYAEKGMWLVVEQAQKLVACVAYFKPFSTQHPLFHAHAAHIQLLGVAPSHTRCGIGRGLMEHCLALAKEDKASELLLQTSELMPEARTLYESLGFKLKEALPPVWGIQPISMRTSRINPA